jgi:hypothetical protein
MTWIEMHELAMDWARSTNSHKNVVINIFDPDNALLLVMHCDAMELSTSVHVSIACRYISIYSKTSIYSFPPYTMVISITVIVID